MLGTRRAALILLILVCASAPRLQAQEIPAGALFEGQPVTAVDVIARPTLDAEPFKHLISQQAGQPYSNQKVEESVQALKSTGKFTDVEPSVVPEKDGLRLKFILQPAFYIGIFEFPGADRVFTYTRLLGAVRYRSGEVFEKQRVEESVPALGRFFAQNGYFNAKVESATQLDEPHQLVTVRYPVSLGKKARFGKIQIAGPPADIVGRLQSSLHSLPARLHGAHLKEGKPYDADRLRSAQTFLQDYLGRQDYLSSTVALTPRYETSTNRAELDFDVSLGPTVVVRATGARVSSKTLHKDVPIFEEKSVDQDLVNIGARNLTSFFQGKGFFDVKVTSQMDTESSKTILTYNIERGSKHRVAEVTLSGNHEFDQARLADQILVKKRHFLSRGAFSEDLLRKTVSNLESYWRNVGYASVKVTPRVVDHAPDLYVTFEINEGTRTVAESFRMQGNRLQGVAVLAEDALSIRPGQPYSPFRVNQDKNRIIAAYLNQGYPNATLRVEATPVSGDIHRVDVTYIVDEGPHVLVSEVIYTGQEHSQVRMIERAVDIKPEMNMSESKLLDGEDNLYNLGVFDWATVSPRRTITDSSNHETNEDVIVKVHEAKRNSITYGLGFESTPRSGSLSTGVLILPGLPTVGLPSVVYHKCLY